MHLAGRMYQALSAQQVDLIGGENGMGLSDYRISRNDKRVSLVIVNKFTARDVYRRVRMGRLEDARELAGLLRARGRRIDDQSDRRNAQNRGDGAKPPLQGIAAAAHDAPETTDRFLRPGTLNPSPAPRHSARSRRRPRRSRQADWKPLVPERIFRIRLAAVPDRRAASARRWWLSRHAREAQASRPFPASVCLQDNQKRGAASRQDPFRPSAFPATPRSPAHCGRNPESRSARA